MTAKYTSLASRGGNNLHLLKVLGGIFWDFENSAADIDLVVYVLRHFTKIISGIDSFAEMLALSGPPNGGKSAVAQMVLSFLGEGKGRACYVGLLPANYLQSSLREDPESSKPVLNALAGSRLLYVKEAAGKPIVGETLKSILDNRDAGVSARANSAARGDSMEVAITWSILSCSQHALKLAESDTDTGIRGKVVEVHTMREFVAEADPQNPRQAVADQGIMNGARQGFFSGELFVWAQALYGTLLQDVCTSRAILPRPACVHDLEIAAMATTAVAKLRAWAITYLVHCREADAPGFVEVDNAAKAAMTAQGVKVDAHVFTAAGFGKSGWKRTRIGGDRRIYVMKLNGTDMKPVKFHHAEALL